MKKKDSLFGTIICTVVFNFITIGLIVKMITEEYSLRGLGATIMFGSFGIGFIFTLIDLIKERKETYKESKEKTLKDLGWLICFFGIIIGVIIVAISMSEK